MSEHKEYRITVDVDDTYEHVHDLFKYESVNIEFWRSFVPPHKVVYYLGPLTETGVENWKALFDDIGAKYRIEERIKK